MASQSGPEEIDRPGESGEVKVETPKPKGPEITQLETSSERQSIEIPPETAGLELRVVDAQGAPMEAAITLTGPDESERLATSQHVRWTDLEPGRWVIKVQAEELIRHREVLELTGGELELVVAQLLPSITLRGVVVDRLGSPVSVPIWFLRRDQKHPDNAMSSRKLKSCTSDVSGRFSVPFENSGPTRVSIGPVGKTWLALDEPLAINSMTDDLTLKLVVPNAAKMVVTLDGATGDSLQVSLLAEPQARTGKRPTRRVAGSPTGGKPLGDRPKKRKEKLEPGDRQGGGGNDTLEASEVSTQEELAAPLPPENETTEPDPFKKWNTRDRQVLSASTGATFRSVPTDRQVCIVLHRKRDTFRSEPFLVGANGITEVTLQPTVRRSGAEREAEPMGPLRFSLRTSPIPADAPVPGATWE